MALSTKSLVLKEEDLFAALYSKYKDTIAAYHENEDDHNDKHGDEKQPAYEEPIRHRKKTNWTVIRSNLQRGTGSG